MLKRPTRTVLAVLAALIVIAAAVAAELALSGEQPPATGAAALVPDDALLYVHLSTDRSRPAVKRALSLTGKLPDYPLLTGAIQTRLSTLLGAPASELRPWLGKEAAFVLLNTASSTAGSLIVLDVARPSLARGFVLRGGAVADGSYGRTELLRYPSGTEAAFVSHYLVLGQSASVRVSIDTSTGRSPSLLQSPAYQRAASDEPDGRVLHAYAPAAGVRRVLGPRSGPLGALGALLDQPALTGTAISLSALPAGLRLDLHSALDPALAPLSAAPTPGFTPALASALPRGAALLLEVNGLAQWAPRILGALGKVGFGGRVAPLLKRLGAALATEGVDVHSLTGIFSGESALAVSPATPSQQGRTRGPALVIVTHTSDQKTTSGLLASAEAPLAQLFPPPSSGPGQAAEFSEVPVSGVTVHRLALTTGLELDYAVSGGQVVLATSLLAIEAIVHHASSLADQPSYQSALGDRPDQVTSLLFLDFSQLLSLGEQTGLVRGERLRPLLPDLEKITAIGLTTTRQESDIKAELFLKIP